jgi:hypothetical protein
MAESDYFRGLHAANRGIKSLMALFGDRKARAIADKKHDKADAKMYKSMACGKSTNADFNRGQATGYGYFAHVGKKLDR